MFIILEGCSLAGKSTLYTALEAELQARLKWTSSTLRTVHHGQPTKLTSTWALQQYVGQWERSQVLTGPDVILADRWHYGERVYAPIYRPDTNVDGYGLLGVAGWRWVEMFLRSRGATVVATRAQPSTLKQRLAARGDDHISDVDELMQVNDAYKLTWRDEIGYRSGEYWSDDNRDPVHVAHRIINAAERNRAAAEHLAPYPEYIGSPRPATLLLGDTRNGGADEKVTTLLPFAPVNGNSGDYLLRTLSQRYVATMGLVNACDIGAERLNELYTSLRHPRVVALGRRAAHVAAEAVIPCKRVNHPQYHRRFKYADGDRYREQIEETA